MTHFQAAETTHRRPIPITETDLLDYDSEPQSWFDAVPSTSGDRNGRRETADPRLMS